jgi:hypothetical protein
VLPDWRSRQEVIAARRDKQNWMCENEFSGNKETIGRCTGPVWPSTFSYLILWLLEGLDSLNQMFIEMLK